MLGAWAQTVASISGNDQGCRDSHTKPSGNTTVPCFATSQSARGGKVMTDGTFVDGQVGKTFRWDVCCEQK